MRKTWDGFHYHMVPKKRERIYMRDGYKCLKCGSTEELTIDHIIPKAKGGRDSLNNYQTLCRECNLDKGEEIADYRHNKTSYENAPPILKTNARV